MYYICNSPEPMHMPSGNPTVYTHAQEAMEEAVRLASERPSNLSWYVHAFSVSQVVYRASSVITVETEILEG